MADVVVPCNQAESETWLCGPGVCQVDVIAGARHPHCKCPPGWDGKECDRPFINLSIFASTQAEKKRIVAIAVSCTLIALIAIAIAILVVIKLRRRRRAAQDALPIVSVGNNSTVEIGDEKTSNGAHNKATSVNSNASTNSNSDGRVNGSASNSTHNEAANGNNSHNASASSNGGGHGNGNGGNVVLNTTDNSQNCRQLTQEDINSQHKAVYL